MSLFSKLSFKNAPLILLGAFFLSVSCKQESPAPEKPEPSTEQAAPSPDPQPEESKAPEISNTPELEENTENQIRFLSYNVKNYLTMTTFLKGGKKGKRSKPEKEIKALIDLIVAEKPQILGLCEIGTKEDLAELQSKLKAAGLDLPHSEHAGGVDDTRHLSLLSSLPISARNSQSDLPFELDGTEQHMRRGILDVTIDLPNGPTHFIGVHFKSKREIKEADQAMIRLNEAQLLRKHCDAIVEKNNDARIVVYGDMNETKGEAPIKALKGHGNSKGYLEDVYARDSRGEVWTHFWKTQHIYSRFDYVFFTRSMKPEMNFQKCYIVDPIDFYDASDHRAIMVTFGR